MNLTSALLDVLEESRGQYQNPGDQKRRCYGKQGGKLRLTVYFVFTTPFT